MKVEHSVKGIRAAIQIAKKAGKHIGFVPTMGNLHKGHITLVKEAKARCDYVVVSIFVNPTQFGENEDLENYPRTLNEDFEKLTNVSCDLVFVPEVKDMYSENEQSVSMHVGSIANQLCGASRPGHFDGVVTVVSKLFNIVKPDMAFFGEKDYQQLTIIRKLNEELAFNIDIFGVPTVREASGLAMSSRNGYLTAEQKQQASALSKCLKKTGDYLKKGVTEFEKLSDSARLHLTQSGFDVDYFEIKTTDLSEPSAQTQEFVVLVAAKVGTTRLIDNMSFKVSL